MGKRFACYIVGAIAAVLLVGTLFNGGPVTYTSVPAALLFGAAVGSLMALVKPLFAQARVNLGWLVFSLLALVLNAILFLVGGLAIPGIDVTIGGALIGGFVAGIASGIAFAIVDG